MRIGVSGPGRSGKTTLVNSLGPRMGLPVIAEGVWEWLRSEGLPEPWDLGPEDVLRLQRHVIGHKIAQESASTDFISDRTTIDAVTLMTLRLDHTGWPVLAELREKALAHAAVTYDVAVLLKQQLAPGGPDSEHGNPAFRKREAELTRALYESAGVPILDVPAMSVSRIASFVERELRQRQPR